MAGRSTFESEGEFEEDGDGFQGYEPEYHPETDEAGEFWCPNCGAEMYGGASLCTRCNEYVTPGRRPGTPRWIWIGLIVVGLAVLGGILSVLLSG